MLKKLHHVAYRCNDAAETVDFYTKVLGLKFAAGLVSERVPSIQKAQPHIHIFLEMLDGSFIAFFELLDNDDPLVPVDGDWAQHLALEVEDEATAASIEARLRQRGVDVVGPTQHEMCTSRYFYDPSGHRIEVTVPVRDQALWDGLEADAPDVLEKWREVKARADRAAVDA